ncbi:hypothetical protein CALVIDRAFT_537161 [Calocera viscosa TUFC12733]|uniref:Uncharacterized protein n=1 Tax=Calocera viscosa (strain TUFC12733) TaxID=1330018 RepID=A0A167M6F0_CALVF|nr:hypothetical protein CALVIDRAFT_537161 [Calocera viscosa TUFC12733]
MLVAMTFHVGLLLITVLALATSQFVIEYGELEHLPPTHTSYQHVPTHDLPHTHSSPPEAHGYPPSGPSSRRTGTAYHPYARARARGRAHKAHRSSVSFPDAYEQMGVEEERGRGSPYGPRVRDPHEAWPYVPEGWRGENGPGEEGEDEDEEEEEDNRPLGVQVGKASPGLWGAEARDKAREIMSGRS